MVSHSTTPKAKRSFIDRKEAVHFSLVHRSQRDASVVDPETSAHVLKPVDASRNLLRKGKVSVGSGSLAVAASAAQDAYYRDELYVDHHLDDGVIYPGLDAGPASDSEDGEFDGGDSDLEGGILDLVPTAVRTTPVSAVFRTSGDAQVAYKAPPLLTTNTGITASDAINKNAKSDKRSAPQGSSALFGIPASESSSYDYSRHLREIGSGPGSVFIPAPSSPSTLAPPTPAKPFDRDLAGVIFKDEIIQDSKNTKDESTRKVRFQLPNLPSEALPGVERPVGVLGTQNSTPWDVDPKLREVIYALDDDAYVQNDVQGIDDFFAALHAPDVPEAYREEVAVAEQEWERFTGIVSQKDDDENSGDEWDSNDEYYSDDDDECYPKSRNRDWDRGTNYSMTSSAMHRNDKLTLLDDQFDKILAEYSDSDIGSDEPENKDEELPNNLSNVPEVDAHFNKILDEFLDDQEVIAGRVFDRSGFVMGADGLQVVREGLKDDRIRSEYQFETQDDGSIPEWFRQVQDNQIDNWDCQTVISTYSNIYNHPKIIRENGGRIVAGSKEIKINARTGMPVEWLQQQDKENQPTRNAENVDAEESDQEEKINKGERRDKAESKEEKKLRKEGIKADRKDRRTAKKTLKMVFAQEERKQKSEVVQKKFQEKSLHLD